MLLLLATVLASTPPTLERTTLRTQLDVGGMLGATWYVPQSRAHLEAVLTQAKGLFTGTSELEARTLAFAAPLVGPLLVARETEDALDRALLLTSGLLQGVGLGVGAARFFRDEEPHIVETGPVVSFSPIAAGRLGLSLRITGF